MRLSARGGSIPWRERVIRNNVFVWAERFLATLASSPEPREVAPAVNFAELKAAYKAAPRRIMIFDYDGTLVPISDDPAWCKPSADLIRNLTRLAADPRNVVAVVSGRRANDMDQWLGGIPNLYLGAEHGLMVHHPSGRAGLAGESGWQTLKGLNPDLQWKDKIRPILEHFVDRAPGSFIEEKEFSLVWHYRRVEAAFGSWLAKELLALLGNLLSDTDARPLHGKKIVEVKSSWANKGQFASWLLEERGPARFVLAVGDDATDEDMFARLNDSGFLLCMLGHGHSNAQFRSLPSLRDRQTSDGVPAMNANGL